MCKLRPPAALVAAFVVCVAMPAAAQQSGPEVEGYFHVNWGDPRDGGEPHRWLSLSTDDGRRLVLELDEAAAAAAGGVERLHGRRIRVQLEAPLAATAADGDLLEATALPERSVGRIRAVREVGGSAVWSALETGAPASLLAAVEGEHRWITLLCHAPDMPASALRPVEHFERLMSMEYPGAGHFWAENSDGRVAMSGSRVAGWFTLPHPTSHYFPSGPSLPARSTMLDDCVAAADSAVHFPDFHGINLQFDFALGCCSWAGGGVLTADGVAKSYHMTWLADWAATSVGTYAHEVGHTLGLPHSTGPYGDTYDSQWDVMSHAHWHLDAATGLDMGGQTIAYHKDMLGWIESHRRVVVQPGDTTILLERSALPGANDNARIALIPIRGDSSHYFTLEARRRAGHDAHHVGEGVVIHLVRPGDQEAKLVDRDGNGKTADSGSRLEVGDRYVDWNRGVEVQVQELVGDAYLVRIRVPEYTTLAVDTTSRSQEVLVGTDSVLVETVPVIVSGPGADTVSWKATFPYGTVAHPLETAGTGSGAVRWEVSTDGLPPGWYITYVGIEGAGRTHLVASRLRILDAGGISLGSTRPVRRDTTFEGAEEEIYRDLVLTGPGADTVAWSLTADVPWLVPDSASGRGSRYVKVSRSAAGLARGTHAGRITVTTADPAVRPLVLTDSLRVLAPVVLEIQRTRTADAGQERGIAVPDSIWVEVTGDDAAVAEWEAAGSDGTGAYLRPPQGPLRGSQRLKFSRSPEYLDPGEYAGHLVIATRAAGGARVELADTFRVEAAAPAIVLSRTGGRDSVVIGFAAAADSFDVNPIGAGSPSMTWATSAPEGIVLYRPFAQMPFTEYVPPGSGTGAGRVWWLRNMDGREPGTYIDTLTVRFSGTQAPVALYVDTLLVLGSPAIAADAVERSGELRIGGAASLADSVALVASGWQAQSLEWTASSSSSWLVLDTPAGVGSGTVRWTRQRGGLPPGEYADTIVVSAFDAGASLRIVDRLVVRPAVIIASDSVRPPGSMGAEYADTLVADGTAPGMRWSLLSGDLPPGLTLDSISGTLGGVPEQAGTFRFTVRLSAEHHDDRQLRVAVEKPVLSGDDVFDHLFGGGGVLSSDHARFLDLLGNRNGRVDVGDVAAWLNDPRTSTAAAAAYVQRTRSSR